jgi:hypothetical protein
MRAHRCTRTRATARCIALRMLASSKINVFAGAGGVLRLRVLIGPPLGL